MENKKQFIEDLSNLLSRYCWSYGIRNLKYVIPGEKYNEEVIVNVSCDNYIAMLKDICKRGLHI